MSELNTSLEAQLADLLSPADMMLFLHSRPTPVSEAEYVEWVFAYVSVFWNLKTRACLLSDLNRRFSRCANTFSISARDVVKRLAREGRVRLHSHSDNLLVSPAADVEKFMQETGPHGYHEMLKSSVNKS